ncbi:HlyD family efflux transporter periplasmic adaptor subunit [Pseudoroseomonas cervicalis]|uniref:HlyD family efflux transporter periplasmic adaptor subunit n=1 Tax=Teichococcus cervicalis TaxID=204525 RepID=UPI0022F14B05|nr:HlyD family efflux transporter periplasmic adaptor subunit [Pseudoroseomonas cervicalis]WBV42790.1 HlyD family efflux transporter periplasmic adaptor subunit [Pseudoroseomonas cervicalis]
MLLAAAALPALRSDLRLHSGPRRADGAPGWTLEDPGRFRFFRLGWLEVECLAEWHRGTAAAVAAAVAARTTLRPAPEQVAALGDFLARNELTRAEGPLERMRLRGAWARRRKLGTQLLHGYLFFRVPLLRPAGFLRATLPAVRWLGSPPALLALGLLSLLGLLLVLRRLDLFLAEAAGLVSAGGLAAFGLALGLAKLLHELGHAYVATAHGVRVPSMGVAFMLGAPLLYTETSGAWRLTRRGPRLAIGGAGLMVETALAGLASLAWALLPPGPGRDAAVLLATAGWGMTLLVNASPFMRFDGYYLLSDALGLENLHSRAFAMLRWRLRETLFGLGEPPPEALSPGLRRFLAGFGLATLLARASLYLAIAFAVYHLFWKPLGIALFVVEFGWFLARPVADELREWARRRHAFRLNRRLLATLAGTALLLAGLLLPLRGTISAPAFLDAAARGEAVVATPGRLVEWPHPAGRWLAAGAVVARLDSPELERRIAIAATALARAEDEQRLALARAETLDRRFAQEEAVRQARAALAALEAERAALEIRAPVAGRLRDLEPQAQPGAWLPRGLRLATLVDDSAPPRLRALLSEAELRRVAPGAAITFLPEGDPARGIPATLQSVAPGALTALERWQILAERHGGPVPADADGRGRLVPRHALYPAEAVADAPAPGLATPGTALIEGEAESLARRAWRHAAAVLIRESGF